MQRFQKITTETHSEKQFFNLQKKDWRKKKKAETQKSYHLWECSSNYRGKDIEESKKMT